MAHKSALNHGAAIANGEGVGLLINDALPGKKGGSFGVIYLRPARFGIRRYFLKLDPDPCGDENPATCEFCTGCSGESSPGGIIHTCVCVQRVVMIAARVLAVRDRVGSYEVRLISNAEARGSIPLRLHQ